MSAPERDVLDRAREALGGITDGPWRWTTPRYGVPELEGRAGDPEVYAYDQTVLEASHSGECGCRSSCELELTITDADREFISAARTLVPELADALEAAREDIVMARNGIRPMTETESNLMTQVLELRRKLGESIGRECGALCHDVERDRDELQAENEELRDLTQAQNGYNAQMTDERDEARADNKRLRTALEAARDSAAQWEGLWRQDQETAATALRERDQALAEVERLRGNQRVEVVEGWHGIAKGSD